MEAAIGTRIGIVTGPGGDGVEGTIVAREETRWGVNLRAEMEDGTEHFFGGEPMGTLPKVGEVVYWTRARGIGWYFVKEAEPFKNPPPPCEWCDATGKGTDGEVCRFCDGDAVEGA